MFDRTFVGFCVGMLTCFIFCGALTFRVIADISKSHEADIDKVERERDAAWKAYQILADEKNVLESE